MKKLKLPVVIFSIFLISLALAVAINFVWGTVEKKLHPDEYRDIVEKYAAEYNIPAYIIFAVIETESGFDNEATSSAGAMGLMQMMPSTFEWLTSSDHLGENLSPNSLYDPEVSIRYGTYYLKYLFEKFYNWDTVFAAYNGGEGNVVKWLSDPEYSDGNGNLTYIPFKETRNYVKKVNKAKDYYKNTYYKNEDGVK
ncbi:MAG: lytic transglycosylase domain-containing protein [Clostridia bacterium]|nr:lytic transglycosylase domain-containing protein [Clostridia bacterium]